MPSIGDIRVDFIANTAKFIAETRRATAGMEAFGKKSGKELESINRGLGKMALVAKSAAAALVALAAAVAGGKIVSGLDHAARKVDELGKAAKRLGVSVQTLSALRFAAGEAGVEFEQLAKLTGKASREIAGLIAGGKQSIQIGRMTVQLTGANGQMRSIGALLPEIARGLKSVGTAGERLRLAESLFGRGGGEEFVQWLEDSGDFLATLSSQTDRARRLGVIFNDDQVRRLTDYRDAVGRVSEAWLGLRVAVMTEVAPFLTEFLDGMAERIAAVPALVRAATRALRDFALGTTEERDRAAKAIEDLRKASMQVLLSGAVEVGKVMAMTFIEVLKAGVITLGPVIWDTIKSMSPALSLAFGAPLAAQIAEAQKRVAKLQAIFDAGGAGVLGGVGLLGAPGKPARLVMPGETAVLRQRATPREEPAELRAAKDALRRLRLDLEIETSARTIATQEALGSAMKSIPQLTTQAAARMQPLLADLAAAKNAIVELYGVAESPPEPAGSSALDAFLGRARSGLESFRTSAITTAKQVGPALSALREKLVALMDYQAGLNIRRAEATGDEAMAAKLRMLRDFAAEERSLAEMFGGRAPAEAIRQLRDVQRLEMGAGEARALADLRREADRIRREQDPRLGFNEDMARLRDLHDRGLLNDDEFRAAAQKMSEDLRRLMGEGERLGDTLKRAVQGFADSAGDAFADLVLEGKANFQALLRSWSHTLLSMVSQTLIFKPILDSIGTAVGRIGKSSGTDPGTDQGAGYGPPKPEYAMGGVFTRGRLVPFAAGGVVTRPMLFPMARGTGLMGEAGPEAVMPLERIGGRLGVSARGAGTVVNIIDQRSGGSRPEVSEHAGPDGRRVVSVLIRDEFRRMMGRGEIDRDLASGFGLSRRPVAR